MQLHLTIGGRWADSIAIDPLRRRDKMYMKVMKELLTERHRELLQVSKAQVEFYLDPLSDKVLVANNAAVNLSGSEQFSTP